MFDSDAEEQQGNDRFPQQLKTINPQNGTSSVVASSTGLSSALWISPETIIAGNQDQNKLLMLDLTNGKLTELVSGIIMNWAVSPDRKYLYYTVGGAEPKTMRMRLADKSSEQIGSLRNLRQALDPLLGETHLSVAPDGSPVFTRDIGSQEIYALTLKWR